MRRLLFEESGSVNIYAMLIIVPVFLFHAVMIDWLRIFMAAKDSENAVKAGARSVLSEYDASLRPYGLFGLKAGSDELKHTFSTIAAANIHQASPGAFSLIDPRLESNTEVISRAGSLANRSVLERQILQDMKYRAPVEYALEVAEKWKKSGLSGQVKEANAFSEAAEQLEGLLDKREKALDEAWDAAQLYTSLALVVQQKESNKLDELHSLAEEIGLVDIDDLRRSIQEVESRLQDGYRTLRNIQEAISNVGMSLSAAVNSGNGAVVEIQALIEHMSALQTEASNIQNSLSNLESRKADLSSLVQNTIRYFAESALSKSALDLDYDQLRRQLDPVVTGLSEARRWNSELAAEKEKQQKKLKGPFPEASEAFASIRIYSMDMFSGYETEAGKISALFNGVRQKWKETIWFVGDSFNVLSGSLLGVQSQTDSFRSAIERQEQERAAFNLERGGKKREQIEKTKQALRLAVSQITSCTTESKKSYEQLKESYNRYRSFAGDLPEEDHTAELDNESYKGKSAMLLGARIMDAVEGVRNELYIDEYMLERFGFRTSGEPNTSGSHPIGNEEVEYLIYGLSSCTLNYSAAYGEMFLLLLSIRTTEVLLSPEQGVAAIGSPLFMFLTALAEGAVMAVVDMSKLVNGESIPLLKRAPAITVNYKDFLRLFLLLHGGNRNVMSRLQGLLQLNSGTDLGEAYTYIQATVETSVRIWFSSRVFRILQFADIGPCVAVQGRCRMVSTAVAAYG